MKTALIGYTGFVGSNIYRQFQFDEVYNSKNIEDIKGKKIDLVVCAGVPAVKWWANKNPKQDIAIIESLADIYKSINTKRFVLISTVDVYPTPYDVTEKTSIDSGIICPYGKHRLLLEQSLVGCFEHFHVLRLPGLFGKGIKKNILFDMLCGNIIDKINLDSSFQWYPLSRIWQDIQKVIEAEITLLNLAVEPISSRLIKETFFTNLDVGSDPSPVSHYNMKTVYSGLFNSSSSDYIMSEDQVLSHMASWLKDPEVNCE